MCICVWISLFQIFISSKQHLSSFLLSLHAYQIKNWFGLSSFAPRCLVMNYFSFNRRFESSQGHVGGIFFFIEKFNYFFKSFLSLIFCIILSEIKSSFLLTYSLSETWQIYSSQHVGCNWILCQYLSIFMMTTKSKEDFLQLMYSYVRWEEEEESTDNLWLIYIGYWIQWGKRKSAAR